MVFFGAKYRVLLKATYVPVFKVNRRAIGIHFCVFIPFREKAFHRFCCWHCGGIFSEKITHFAIAFRLHGNQFLTGLHERKQRLIIRL
jgi:hypothetical protein